MVVRQNGADVSAAIMRVDGDTGTLTGSYKDGTFTISHFSGARPTVMEVTPAADGSLQAVGGSEDDAGGVPRNGRSRENGARTHRSRHSTSASWIRRRSSVQLSRRRREDRVRYRPPFSGQGRHRQPHRHLVPELPRRGAVSVQLYKDYRRRDWKLSRSRLKSLRS